MEKSFPLEELIDVEELQSIQDSFARAAGISSVILSPEGEPLTRHSNPTGFCSLIQSTGKGKKRCFKSFMEMGKIAFGSGEQKIFYCFAHSGNFVVPIIIDGDHKGTMFAGQFIPEKFSPVQLRDLEVIAHEIDIDPGLLLKEAEKMSIVGEDVIRDYSDLLFKIVETIARRGALAAELIRARRALQVAHDELERSVQERTADLAEAIKGLKHEITEREQTEESLRKNEEKFRLLSENSIDCIWLVDTRLRFTYLSPSVERMLGFKPEQCVGSKLSSHFKKKEFLKAGVIAAKGIKNYKTFTHVTFETKILNSNNDEVDVEISSKVLLNSQGKLIGLQGITRDITERKKAEKILKDSKIKLQLLYDSSSDAIMLLDEKGFFDCNEATLRLFGCANRKEFCGRHQAYFSPPTQPDGTDSMIYARNNIAVALKKGSKRFEHLYRRLDGTDFPAEVLLDALMLGGKKVLQARVYDITKRKRIEQALNDRVELEKIIASISTSFINLAPDEIDIGIKDALRSIGKFAGVDRSYIFRLFDDGTKADNTHEWCAEEIVPQIENLKGLSVADFPWFLARLNRFETVHVPIVANLPSEAKAEKEELQSQDILSVILVPMVYARTLLGFIGFDSVRQEKNWSEENITLLRIVCEIFVNALERKRVMNALKDSEEKYRLLADNMADCIWQMNTDFEFTYANSSVHQMFGFTQDEWIGSSLAEHCSPEAMELVTALVMELLKKGFRPDITTFEMQLLHKNGNVVTAEINGKILFDENKNPVGFQGSTRDITERKAAEEEIKKKTDELEKFNRLAVGRELKMIKLKKEINALLEKSGKEPGYKIAGEPQAEVF